MFNVYQVCRSDLDGCEGLGGGGRYEDPTPVKTFSTRQKATKYLKSVVDKKEWRIKWSIQKLKVY